MPVFDFTCDACDERFDKLFRTMTDKPKAACPKCGSKKTRRALSLVNAGKSEGKSSDNAAGDLPACGTCGVPGGPCAMN
jgi:putative FmdB family regulatory protein